MLIPNTRLSNLGIFIFSTHRLLSTLSTLSSIYVLLESRNESKIYMKQKDLEIGWLKVKFGLARNRVPKDMKAMLMVFILSCCGTSLSCIKNS